MHSAKTSRRRALQGLLIGGAAGHLLRAQNESPALDDVDREAVDMLDPALRDIANRVADEMTLAIEKVIAHEAEAYSFPLPTDPGAAEHLIRQRFESLSEGQRRRAVDRAAHRFRGSYELRQRLHGELAAVDLHSPTPIAEQASRVAFPVSVVSGLSKLQYSADSHRAIVAPADAVVANSVSTLALRIHTVRCVDETDNWLTGERFNDEIVLGGTAVDATGVTRKIPHFEVASNFDDLEKRTYDPPRLFALFNTRLGTEFPKTYVVTLVLAETDAGGGTADFIKKLFEQVRKEVISRLTVLIGGLIGASGGVVGAAVGLAVSYAVDKVVAALKAAFEDDIFPPQTVSLAISSSNHTFSSGKHEGPHKVARFKGHGGYYQVTYSWYVKG